jgi:hypothetical protein
MELGAESEELRAERAEHGAWSMVNGDLKKIGNVADTDI